MCLLGFAPGDSGFQGMTCGSKRLAVGTNQNLDYKAESKVAMKEI